ncbi:NHL repeat-containing protein [Gracilimonas mengyeensis]|uniref:NHL repeat-containing protein n=2 Tax=Gracilimonas mengyeensis TaxID=1302730 RepID=A0A521EJ33_9BACT|nr:NHL repeat-containing protein [Gracilimonas mengyeensis]
MKAVKGILLLGIVAIFFSGCDTIFGSKQNDTTDEIFEVGRIDPTLEQTDGYVALTPFWEGFDNPTDVHVGFDEFVYVTDAEGVHLLDRADLSPRKTIEFDGAVSVTQDRLLNVYVVARYDTVIQDLDPNVTWNLPAVYKLRNLNGTDGPNPVFLDTLIHPFDDASRASETARRARLVKDDVESDEHVEFTGVTVLEDNSIYVTRRGPLNSTTEIAAPDNIVLEFAPIIENGQSTAKMRNVRQIRTLSPVTPSLLSSVGPSDIASFVSPPQRDVFPDNRSFLITQADQSADITFRVLQVNAVETPDGLVYRSQPDFLERDTSRSSGFLYEENKFIKPVGLAVAGDQTGYIFVVDQEQNKLYQFQPNGYEGVTPPPGAVDRSKNLIVSFGEQGNGPRQFNNPSGVAYFDEIVYVADTGNNRIARYRLTTDFE